MTRLKYVGNLACMGGGGGGNEEDCAGGEEVAVEDGVRGVVEEACARDEGAVEEGHGSGGVVKEACAGGEEGAVEDGNGGGGVVEEACAGDKAGDVGDGGGGGEYSPNVVFRASSSPAPRSFSGVNSSFEADCRTAAVPLFLARTAALWLARDAVSAAFALFTASGRALYTRTCAEDVEDNCCKNSGESVTGGGNDS